MDLNFGGGWYWNGGAACPCRVILPQEIHGFALGHEYVYVECLSGIRQQFSIPRYAPMYRIPYLYEEIVYRHLGCRTPGGMINVIDRAFRLRAVR
ncbi:hypothetical protein [Methanoregula sp.]|uniref:hypothetical protein n=1 Tax=Methanoregula sp. TaxID=2052170 RepID=UPI0035634BEE